MLIFCEIEIKLFTVYDINKARWRQLRAGPLQRAGAEGEGENGARDYIEKSSKRDREG